MLWIGHYDLTASLGIPGQFDHPDFREALDRVVEACRQNGIAAGMSTDSLADAHELLDRVPLRRLRPRPRAAAHGAAHGHRRASRRPSPSRDPSGRDLRRDAVAKQVIRTDSAGPPLGAYSQGIRAGDFIFVSGCGPIDATHGRRCAATTVEEQTHVVLDNITAILEAGGASLADVVKATVHLADETGVPRVQRGLRGAHARAAAGAHHGRKRPAPGARDARRGRRDRVCRG